MTAPKIYVAIPVYGGLTYEFVTSLMHVQGNPPVPIAIKFLPGDSLVSRARNSLTAAFLQSDCTHLLFIDSDLEFSGEQIKRLLDHNEDVVAGFYPKKKDGQLEWVCNALDNSPTASGLQEVRYMGTGFMLVKRAVFEQMIAKYGEQIAYAPDHAQETMEWDLWPVGTYKFPNGVTRYLSEDWYFCQRWLDLGGKVYGDTRIILRHVGHAKYPLQSQMKDIVAPESLTGGN